MSEFRRLPDDIYREAGEVIRSVSGKGERSEVEVMPGFEAMVAGVAVALGKAAPNALYDTSTSNAEDWVNEGSSEWRHLHTAAAHAIDAYRSSANLVSGKPAEVMTYMASDVLTQTAAKRMEMAVKDVHPAFSKGLDENQVARVEEARMDRDEARSIHAESYGNYSDLARWRQDGISESLVSGGNLAPAMKEQIALIADMVQRDIHEVGPRVRRVDERLADFAEPENSKPLFQPVSVLEMDQVRGLIDGGQKPHSRTDYAILAHVEVVGHVDEVSNLARAQALADMEIRRSDGGMEVQAHDVREIAVRIEAHRLAMEDARKRAFDEIDWPSPMPDHIEELAWGKRTDRFAPETQVGLFQAVEHGDRVPGLLAMQLSLRSEEMFEQGLSAALGRDAREVAGVAPEFAAPRIQPEEGYDVRISKEGGYEVGDLYDKGFMIRHEDGNVLLSSIESRRPIAFPIGDLEDVMKHSLENQAGIDNPDGVSMRTAGHSVRFWEPGHINEATVDGAHLEDFLHAAQLIQKEIALNPTTERVITYEGIDRSGEDERLLNNLYLPGDRVRIDEKINVSGVDRDALKEQLGSEPLEISKTVVRGEERENHMGGTNQVSIMQYEFKGHEGRFPAPSFQHERGDEHAYGMVAVVDQKLWLVPLDEKLIAGQEDSARVTGPAREITATSETINPQENARRFESMKQMITEEGPSAGEFVFRPQAFGAKDGPVDLIAVPWMSGTSQSEKDAGFKAIAEVGQPRAGVVQAFAASMAASQSR